MTINQGYSQETKNQVQKPEATSSLLTVHQSKAKNNMQSFWTVDEMGNIKEWRFHYGSIDYVGTVNSDCPEISLGVSTDLNSSDLSPAFYVASYEDSQVNYFERLFNWNQWL